MKLSLAVKFNLVFLAVFLIGFVAAGFAARDLLRRSAVEETVQNARVLMEAAGAAQNYTSTQVTPLLQTQLKYSFVPQSVPAFSAVETLMTVQKHLTGYSYRSTMLNPTNPRDRPSDWETDVIRHLRDRPELKEVVGVRDTPSGPNLYIARPNRINDVACMECHSVPSRAPKTLIDKYGPDNGFNWAMHEVIGAEFVSVPMALPVAHSETMLRTFLVSLLVVFVWLLLALNAMVHLLVTRRIRALSRAADEASLGKLDGATFTERGRDEIASLAASFARMKTSLVEAFKMIEA
jgi:HAMP domain-containing protein